MQLAPPSIGKQRSGSVRERPRARILQALLRYYYLTADHVCRLFYSQGSLTTASAWMLRLTNEGVVGRWRYQKTYPAHVTYVYYLTRKGLRSLEELGVDLPERFFPARGVLPGALHIEHTLALNDWLIRLELLERERRDVRRRQVLHEYELKRMGTRVRLTAGKERTVITATVIPDAWVDLGLLVGQHAVRRCFAVELDRGTEGQKRWRAKVRALVAWAQGPYRETFQSERPTIAVFTTAANGKLRCNNLRRWTADTLDEVSQEQGTRLADLFRFSYGALAEISPHELFVTPRWYATYDATPVALLAGLAA